MPQRVKTLQPDQTIDTPNGPIAVVSDGALEYAMAQAAAVLQVAGGALTVVTERLPTGRPNESVTIGALIEWRSHTRAKPSAEDHVQSYAEPIVHPPSPPAYVQPLEAQDTARQQELAAAVMAQVEATRQGPRPIERGPGASALPYQEPPAAVYANQAGPPPDGPAYFDGEDQSSITGMEG